MFIDDLGGILKAQGVDTIFGLPGSTIGPLLEYVLRDPDLRFVGARHESGAVAMADGYARATGKLGVALVTGGPGALNALPYLAVANADNSPVLLIAGQTAHRGHGRGAFQDGVDVVETFRPCTKFSASLAHPQSAVTVLNEAIRHAVSAPRGAVHVSVPVDLCYASAAVTTTTVPAALWESAAAHAAVAQVADALAGSRRPLILLGNGSRTAFERDPELVKRLADYSARNAFPVATTLKGKGLFPEDRDEALGVISIGGSPRARSYVAEGALDHVVVVGSGLGEWASRAWSPGLRPTGSLTQVDLDPTRIGRSYTVDRGVVADAGAFLTALLDAGVGGTAAAVRTRRAGLDALPPVCPVSDPAREVLPLRPQAAMAELGRWLNEDEPRERILFLDVGNTTGWFVQRVPVAPPTRVLIPWGMASMGWANAALIGAKLARPDLPCLTVTGDGGFLMNAVEIATAAQHRMGLVWVVFDDNRYNMVHQGMRAAFPHSFHDDNDAFALGHPELAMLAESLGARPYTIRFPGELRGALSQAEAAASTEHRPQVVCVHIDPDEPGPFGDRNAAVTRSFGSDDPSDHLDVRADRRVAGAEEGVGVGALGR